jgi:hypothetical protein
LLQTNKEGKTMPVTTETVPETKDERTWDDLNTDLNLDEDKNEDWGETVPQDK